MKRIEYENIENCENEYLKSLKLKDEKGYFTKSYTDLNNEWHQIRKNIPVLYNHLPKNVKKLLVAPYEKIVNYFLILTKASDSDIKNINEVFDEKIKDKSFQYDNFRTKIRDFFITNSDKLNICSCYYCDAAYTGVFGTTGAFDVEHFFPNKQYPIFCLSLYNFVPSCQLCNSSRVKGKTPFLEFYSFKKETLQRFDLLHLSPASKNYDVENNLTIKVK